MPKSESDPIANGAGRSTGDASLPVILSKKPAEGYTDLPAYSRADYFNPEVKIEASKGGYVIIADDRSATPPAGTNAPGYVSAGDPAGILKRPPSLPLIPKSFSIGDSDQPLGAYCRVGKRENPTNPGQTSVVY